MNTHLATLTAAVALALAACGAPVAVGPEPDLAGSWELTDGTGPDGPVPILDDHPITLIVEEDATSLGGTAACNSYGGEVELDGEQITISQLVATEMACSPPEVMESEQAYLAALREVDTVTRDGDRLVLAGDDVELEFVLLPEPEDQALVGTTWVLDTLIDGDAASSVPDTDQPVTLELDEDATFAASTGCNTLDGEVVERGPRLELTPTAMTEAACPDVQDLEDHVLAVLDGEVDWEVDGSRLTLTADDGLGLSYRADG